MSMSVLEQAKIQAQVLVPLIKAMQAELGEARANALVRKALGDVYRGYGEAFWRARNESSLGKTIASAFKAYGRDGALDYHVTEQSQDAFEFDVTSCRYAEFYKELGLADIGYLVHCNRDHAMVGGFNPELKLTRTRTIMEGASHCDFRFAKKASTKA